MLRVTPEEVGMTLTLRTRPLPRPLPGTAPIARTPGAAWYRYGRRGYALERESRGTVAVETLARVDVDGDLVTPCLAPAPAHEAHHIAADLAALVGWLSRGGR